MRGALRHGGADQASESTPTLRSQHTLLGLGPGSVAVMGQQTGAAGPVLMRMGPHAGRTWPPSETVIPTHPPRPFSSLLPHASELLRKAPMLCSLLSYFRMCGRAGEKVLYVLRK